MVIAGTQFGTGHQVTAVSFGGTAAASFTIDSDIQISAVVGSGASGAVSVTTPGGTVTLSGFTLAGAPTLSFPTGTTNGISPAEGSAGTEFIFFVDYTSATNDAPTVAQLQIDLDGDGSYAAATSGGAGPWSGWPGGALPWAALLAAGLLLAWSTRFMRPTAPARLAMVLAAGLVLAGLAGCAESTSDEKNKEDTEDTTDTEDTETCTGLTTETNTMVAADSTDTDYTDGKLYTFTGVICGEPRTIRYQFNFSDGEDVATGGDADTFEVTITQ